MYEADIITSNSDLKWIIPATFGDIIFADSAFERHRCIRSQFWYIMWLRMFYGRILHDFRKECTYQQFWALNCCFWLYFASYATYEWFEVLLTVHRVLGYTISTSKAHFDIVLVALHTYTDLHIHPPVQIWSYIHFYQYNILSSTQTHTHLPLQYMDTYIPIFIYLYILYTHSSIYKDTTPNNSVASITTYYHRRLPLLTATIYYNYPLNYSTYYNATVIYHHQDHVLASLTTTTYVDHQQYYHRQLPPLHITTCY